MVWLARHSPRWDGREDDIWQMWSYVARYGKQPLSELKVLPMRDLIRFSNELSRIVREEQTRSEE